MKRSEALFGLLRIPLDTLAVAAALLLSYRLREARIDLIPGVQLLEPASTLPPLSVFAETFVIPGIAAFLLIAAVLKLYALRTTKSAWSEVGGLIVTSLLWLVAVMAWFFLVEKQLFYSRLLLVHATGFMALFTVLVHASTILLQRAFLRKGIGVRLALSVGKLALCEEARRVLTSDPRYNYLGHIPDVASLRQVGGRRLPDLVLQTDPNPDAEATLELIEYCRSHHVGYGFLPPVFADVPHLLRVERLGLLPLMRFEPTPLDGWGKVWKRAVDFAASLGLLILLSPLLLLIAVTIVLTSGWPVFYRSERVGETGRRRLPMWKFRSMIRDADAQRDTLRALNHRTDGPLFKVRGDPRVTRFGAFLRRWSLDELPQLLNVLLGQMSLVGPRPHLPQEVDRYSSYERRVFAVKPGITGLAQVSGRSDLSFPEEVKLDLQYIEEWSLLLDLWILWRTLVVVLKRSGAD